ncbi:MAG: long-chain fatty acid--CoA ligase [Rhodothermia bacterium]|nr:long-chain fatty acid--CoA ligase [Rhodothermia bacterium]
MRTDWLARNAQYYPHKTAIVWQPEKRRISFAECEALGNQTAQWLAQEHGLNAGDRVAILAENSLTHLLLFFACQKAGFVLVPINYRLTPAEVQYIVEDSDPTVLFYGDSFAAYISELTPRCLPVIEVPQVIVSKENTPREYLQNPEDAVMILYTSGTTGRPKGAMMTHKMLAFNAYNTIMRLDLTTKDISFNAAPFYHTGGWNVLLTPFLLLGATTILLDRFDPAQILHLCEAEQMSIIWGVPTMMKMLSDDPQFPQANLKSVRYAIVGGEPMPIPLIEKWQEKGVPIRQGFGMTEVGPNCFSLPEEDAIRKAGSIGFPNFYVDVRVVDNQGNDVPLGTTGELLMRGPMTTSGYWRNEAATQESLKEGWFYTGDLVRIDDEGYCYVAGRKKDMYISGGENVYPAEVEKILYQHPAIAEAAVIGVPDAKWGETGMAFVSLKPNQTATEIELIAHCRNRVARYKTPSYVRFLPELPKGHSGKILKKDLMKSLFTNE